VGKNEFITAYVPVREFDDQHFLVMATKMGMVKKTVLSAYGNPRKGGINAISLQENDSLIEVKMTNGTTDIIIGTHTGQAIRFTEEKVRPMGRTSRGVKGITLTGGDIVIGMVVVKRQGSLLVVTENGFGKRTDISDYRVTGRGGKGIITMKTNERNGKMIAILEVLDDDELMIISKKGIVIRTPIEHVSIIGRNTQGVRLINLEEGDKVIDIARILNDEEAKTNPPGNGKTPALEMEETPEAEADEEEQEREGGVNGPEGPAPDQEDEGEG